MIKWPDVQTLEQALGKKLASTTYSPNVKGIIVQYYFTDNSKLTIDANHANRLKWSDDLILEAVGI